MDAPSRAYANTSASRGAVSHRFACICQPFLVTNVMVWQMFRQRAPLTELEDSRIPGSWKGHPLFNRAFTAAATRPPSARPEALALTDLMT